MKTLQRILIVAIVTGGGMPALAQAPPSYLVLRSPHNNTVHAMPRHYPAHVQPHSLETNVHRSTYAYGWFGVAPRQHWSRHTGYYRNYSQWSAR